MMSEPEVEEKLREMARSFYIHFWNHKYQQAKRCYDKAIDIATFLDLPIKFRMEMFGNRPYVDDDKNLEEGLFREEDVQKAYQKCFENEEEILADEKARFMARRR